MSTYLFEYFVVHVSRIVRTFFLRLNRNKVIYERSNEPVARFDCSLDGELKLNLPPRDYNFRSFPFRWCFHRLDESDSVYVRFTDIRG